MTKRARWCWLVATGWAVSCGLNPQPDLPGDASSGPDDNQGGSLNLGSGGTTAPMTPAAGKGSGNTAGSFPSAEGGAGSEVSEGGAGGATEAPVVGGANTEGGAGGESADGSGGHN